MLLIRKCLVGALCVLLMALPKAPGLQALHELPSIRTWNQQAVSPMAANGQGVKANKGKTGNTNRLRVVDGKKFPQSMAGIQRAINDLRGPGTVWLPCGKYQGTATIRASNSVVIQGARRDCVIIELTNPGSAVHGIVCEAGCVVQDLTMLGPSPNTDLFMTAIRFSSFENGSATAPVNFTVERVKVTGFNLGIFADGRGSHLTSLDLKRVLISEAEVAITGCPSDLPCESFAVHGATTAVIQNNKGDNQFTGDHVIYGIQDKNITVRRNTLQNVVSGPNAFAVKLQNQNGAAVYNRWRVIGNTITNVGCAVLVNTQSADELHLADISHNDIRRCTDPGNSCIQVLAEGTSAIDEFNYLGNQIQTVESGGISLSTSTAATIRHVGIYAASIRDFSKHLPGWNNGISGAGILSIVISGYHADGNKTGRAGYSLERIGNLQVSDFVEINTTDASSPGFRASTAPSH